MPWACCSPVDSGSVASSRTFSPSSTASSLSRAPGRVGSRGRLRRRRSRARCVSWRLRAWLNANPRRTPACSPATIHPRRRCSRRAGRIDRRAGHRAWAGRSTRAACCWLFGLSGLQLQWPSLNSPLIARSRSMLAAPAGPKTITPGTAPMAPTPALVPGVGPPAGSPPSTGAPPTVIAPSG